MVDELMGSTAIGSVLWMTPAERTQAFAETRQALMHDMFMRALDGPAEPMARETMPSIVDGMTEAAPDEDHWIAISRPGYIRFCDELTFYGGRL